MSAQNPARAAALPLPDEILDRLADLVAERLAERLQPAPQPSPYLSIRQAAEWLCTSRPAVDDLLSRGVLPQWRGFR